MHRSLRSVTTLALTLLLTLAFVPSGIGRPADRPSESPGEVVVFFENPLGETEMISTLGEAGVSPDSIDIRRPDMAVVEASDTVQASDALNRLDAVAATGPNGVVTALEVPPNDTAYLASYAQRNYLGPADVAPHSLHVEPVWEAVFNDGPFAMTPDRPGVTVAVIDTGATPSLFEDTGDYYSAYDYVNRDTDASDDASLLGYHGTRVAQLIRAKWNNASGIAGILGTVDLRVRVYKCLDRTGSGSSADAMQAMRDAADAGARVINVSLGERATTSSYGSTPDPAARKQWQDTVNYCRSRGALVVAASGNDAARGYTPVFYPAACTGALAVGSIDVSSGDRSSYSCYGTELDIVAPGQYQPSPKTGIWTVPPSGTPDRNSSGTSFATPMVSGSVALLWSLVPRLSVGSIEHIVTSTADADYGPAPGFDVETGWGLLDVYAAYNEMTSTVAAQAPVTVSATKPKGLETRLSWSAASGSNVKYLYGYEGGPEYATTARSGRLFLSSDGTHTVYVRSFATDRWGAALPGTSTVVAASGLADISSERISGNDRYETAAAVSRTSFAKTSSAAVIALGTNWPDALSAGALAYRAGGPLLLTKTDDVPVPTRDELVRLRPSTIYLIGGTTAVSNGVQALIGKLVPSAKIVRLGGSDRYRTAYIVAKKIKSLPGSAVGGTVIVASGENYPDALSGASLAARAGWPILLTRSGSLPPATASALSDLRTTKTIVLGGEAAVSASVFRALPKAQRWGGADRYETSRIIADKATSLGILSFGSVGLATGKSFPDALSAGPYAAQKRAPTLLIKQVDSSYDTWLSMKARSVTAVRIFGGPAAVPYNVEFDVLGSLRSP